MRLKQWCELKGRGEMRRLMRVTKIAYSTIHGLANDEWAATGKTAEKISAATGGKVTIAELCTLPPMLRDSTRRKRLVVVAVQKKPARKKKRARAYAQPQLALART